MFDLVVSGILLIICFAVGLVFDSKAFMFFAGFFFLAVISFTIQYLGVKGGASNAEL